MMQGYYRQAPRLLSLMNENPERWKKGVIVIRIGVNSIGQTASLNQYAKTGVTVETRQEIMACYGWIKQAIQLIRSHHPDTRMVLVGIFDNANWVPNFQLWHSHREHNNISQVLNLFDNALKELADADPHIVFFDDCAWFRKYWGYRYVNGQQVCKDRNLGEHITVHCTQGNDPSNMVLADGHTGTAWNLLWSKELVHLLNTAFGLKIPEINDTEIYLFMQQNH